MLSLTCLPVPNAADVDGCGSPEGESGGLGRTFLNVGLTLSFIHVTALILFCLTPSAALLTLSIKSPRECKNNINRGVRGRHNTTLLTT